MSSSNRYLDFTQGSWIPKGSKPILWPVSVWEILIPLESSNRINILQRTILGLIEAGKDQAKDIALWMGIERDMVAYIISSQLIPNGWLVSTGELTAKGLALVNEEIYRRRSLTSVFIFEDRITGKVWPRVAKELPDIEPSHFDNKGRPVFKVDRNRGWEDIPLSLKEPNYHSTELDVGQVRGAIQQHNIAVHNQKFLKAQTDLTNEELDPGEVEVLSSKPVDAFVLCRVFEDYESELLWSVNDPIGVGSNGEWLREGLLSQFDNDLHIPRYLASIIGEPEENETWTQRNARIVAKAKMQIFSSFRGVEKIPHLAQILGVLIRREQEILDTDDSSVRFENCNSIVSECAKLFEACFRWMLDEWPVAHKRAISGDWKNEDLVNIYRAHWSGILSEKSIQNLSKQPATKIWGAAFKFRDSSALKPLMGALLFSLRDHVNHPLAQLKPGELDFDRILSLLPDRNEISHASSIKIEKESALGTASFTKNWINNLLDFVG